MYNYFMLIGNGLKIEEVKDNNFDKKVIITLKVHNKLNQKLRNEVLEVEVYNEMASEIVSRFKKGLQITIKGKITAGENVIKLVGEKVVFIS